MAADNEGVHTVPIETVDCEDLGERNICTSGEAGYVVAWLDFVERPIGENPYFTCGNRLERADQGIGMVQGLLPQARCFRSR